MPGIGFPDGIFVAAGDAVEQVIQFQPAQHPDGRALQFIGADRGAVAVPTQRHEGLAHPRKGAGQPRRIGLIEGDIPRQQLGGLFGAAAAGGEGAGHKGRNPVADHRHDLLRNQRRIPTLMQDFVQRIGQIRDAVDQRAVEVEEQKEPGHQAICAAPVILRNNLCVGRP